MRFKAILLPLFISATVGACTVPGPGEAPDGIFDPQESANRRVHEFNKSLDKAVVGPVGKGYVSVVPEEIVTVVGNFSDNLSTPSSVANQILQLDLAGATRNTLRFVLNTTLGIGGLADVAKEFGLDRDPSDFGETLYVWGAPEGSYLELPVLGPSTERAAIGRAVDLFTNPLSYVLTKPQSRAATGAKVMELVGDRGEYADIIAPLLYDSADRYAQARLLYLQNRRHELGDEAATTYITPDDIDTEGF
jgi:phospholipid-binding lipoprotein MlaA